MSSQGRCGGLRCGPRWPWGYRIMGPHFFRSEQQREGFSGVPDPWGQGWEQGPWWPPPSGSAPRTGAVSGQQGFRMFRTHSGRRALCHLRPPPASQELVPPKSHSHAPRSQGREQAALHAESLPRGHVLDPGRGCRGPASSSACPAPPPLADAPLGDRPWERAPPGPEGTVACPRPHVITAAIGTINNPPRNPAD